MFCATRFIESQLRLPSPKGHHTLVAASARGDKRHDNTLLNPKLTVCATNKVSKVKNYFDPGDLENKFKIK